MISTLRQSRSYSHQAAKQLLRHSSHGLYYSDNKSTHDSGLSITPIRRHYSITPRRENTLILGGVSVLAVAVTARVGMKAYEEYQANKSKAAEAEASASNNSSTDKQSDNSSASNEGFFKSFFATTFYDGGFEDKMTKREAALILGVRESATVDRIKDAHRRILINNHPDRGGSPFIAAKVNEAKDLLLKGKQ
mmetsp:Transcript_347/g.638  ORF Transcript_347/g.638 Transcript_347/m.638 type:complete len:193 (+) Transcript_347:65-643(+)